MLKTPYDLKVVAPNTDDTAKKNIPSIFPKIFQDTYLVLITKFLNEKRKMVYKNFTVDNK